MKEFTKTVAVLLAIVFASSCMKNGKTETENNNVPCKRIVSTAPSITETLYELGLGENVAGVTENCLYPEAAKSKPKIGKAFNINVEAVAALKPDTVFVLSAYGELAGKLQSVGIKTVVVEQSAVRGFVDSIATFAQTCGIEEKGKAFRKKFTPYLDGSTVRNSGKRIMILVGRDYESVSVKDAYIVGKDGFLNEIIMLSGAENVYQGDMPYPKIQIEGIIALNPDIVIDVITASDLTPEKLEFLKKSWSEININAVKDGKVFIKTEDFWSLPGPRFIKIIEEIRKIVE
ncbi:ABC transporter substrate-binding protein [bacterium]|nr:ABC transporter substrate-binding protein [bacterium]